MSGGYTHTFDWVVPQHQVRYHLTIPGATLHNTLLESRRYVPPWRFNYPRNTIVLLYLLSISDINVAAIFVRHWRWKNLSLHLYWRRPSDGFVAAVVELGSWPKSFTKGASRKWSHRTRYCLSVVLWKQIFLFAAVRGIVTHKFSFTASHARFPFSLPSPSVSP